MISLPCCVVKFLFLFLDLCKGVCVIDFTYCELLPCCTFFVVVFKCLINASVLDWFFIFRILTCNRLGWNI